MKVDEKFLLNDIVFSVPKELFVFALFVDIDLDEKVVCQIDKLHKNGYEFAVNDANVNDEFMQKYRAVFHQISFVKINFDVLESYNIAEFIAELHENQIEVIGTKIEDQKTYELAKSVGCDCFEGYSFAKPVILENAKYEPFQLNVFKLYNLLMQDVNIDEITSEFEKNPEITAQLLQFINSAAFHFSDSVKEAVLDDAGLFGEIYAVVRATESFDIDEITVFERKHNLEQGTLKNLLIEAIEYVNEFENSQENAS